MDDNSPETVAQRRIPRPEDFPIAGPNSLAGLGQRTAGWLIDAFVTFVPVFVVALVIIYQADPNPDTSATPTVWDSLWLPVLPPLMLLAMSIVWVVYQILLTHLTGTTIGGFATGVRVARYTDGDKPDWSQATLRALLPGMFFAMPSVILNTLWFVVYAAALYNPLRRGLQDQAGGTIVVRTR